MTTKGRVPIKELWRNLHSLYHSLCRLLMIKWCFCLYTGKICQYYLCHVPQILWNISLKEFYARLSQYNYRTYKPHIWIKCPLRQKGSKHVLLQNEVPIKVVWPNPHPSYHALCGSKPWPGCNAAMRS